MISIRTHSCRSNGDAHYKQKYIVMIFDDYSSFATCTLIQSKSETLAAIKSFITAAESFITAAELKLNSKVKSFRSDRGGEFMSHTFENYLKSKGIE